MNEGILRWWWIRHAPTVGPAHLIHGTDDTPADLSDAIAMSRLAKLLPADAIGLTSAVPRAIQTYDALRQLNRDLTTANIDSDLGEQDFGKWTGRSWDELAPITRTFWNDPIGTAPPGGESYRAMCQRVQRSIAMRSETQRGNLVTVAHAGPIRAALAIALDMPFESSIRFEIAPLSLTRIDAIATTSGVSWRVLAVNVRPGDFNADY